MYKQFVSVQFGRCFPLKGSWVLSSPERAEGWAGGRADKHRLHTRVHNFSRIIFKLGKNICYPKISDECDHGGSASLNMRIMDHLMSRPLLAFLNSFFQAKVTKCDKKVGLNMLINISSGFFHNRQKKIGRIFFSHFATSHMQKSPLALSLS